MGFQLVAYDKLALSVKESIKTLLKHHELDPNKLSDSVEKLDDERRIQAQLLLTIVTRLEESPISAIDKARVLNAAVYYIWDKISATYQYIRPERSNLYNSLTSSLELTKENQPAPDDLLEMYVRLGKFLSAHVYNAGDPRKGYLSEQVFSPEKIKGYHIESDIKTLAIKSHVLKMDIIALAEKTHEKEMLDAKKGSGKSSKGLLGLFATSSSSEPSPASSSSVKKSH